MLPTDMSDVVSNHLTIPLVKSIALYDFPHLFLRICFPFSLTRIPFSIFSLYLFLYNFLSFFICYSVPFSSIYFHLLYTNFSVQLCLFFQHLILSLLSYTMAGLSSTQLMTAFSISFFFCRPPSAQAQWITRLTPRQGVSSQGHLDC